MRQSGLEITHAQCGTQCSLAYMTDKRDDLSSAMCHSNVHFSYRVRWDGFPQAYSGREQLCECVRARARACVIQIKQHILASMYFALGGFPWLCHMLHVSKKGEGTGIMQDALSLPHSLTRSPFACIRVPGDAPHPACLVSAPHYWA